MKTTKFVLVRHAESTWNAIGRWQGHGDPPLSTRGHAQAAQIAQQIDAEPVDLMVCSDLRRTRETASYFAAALGVPVEPNQRLRELDVGRWTGLTRKQILAMEPRLLERFESGDPDVRPGGGETRREIRQRVGDEIERLACARPGCRILLVVHAGVIRALVPSANPGNVEVVEVSYREIERARKEASTSSQEPQAN